MLRILRAVAQVLDMSDPDHEAFVDSAADCLDALLLQQETLRALLASWYGTMSGACARECSDW
jgi:hypothetical protein